jgi:hypothetical protein
VNSRLRRWLAPVAAAAAVLAIAIALVVVRIIPNGTAGPAKTPPRSASRALAAAAAPGRSPIPAYYAALTQPLISPHGTGSPVVIVGTRTGKVLVSVPPPRGDIFAGITGAVDGRMFVVDTEQASRSLDTEYLPRSWYLLRLSTSGGRLTARLSKLPIPATANGSSVEGIALSPDGTRLAVAVQPHASNGKSPALLRVYSVATGAVLRTWTAPASARAFGGPQIGYPDQNTELQWADGDRELAFTSSRTTYAAKHSLPQVHVTVRLLDTTRAGSGLIADSRVIWSSDAAQSAAKASTPTCSGIESDLLITADGTTVVCGAKHVAEKPGPGGTQLFTWTVSWLEYSAATGKLVRALPAGTVTGRNMDFLEDPLRLFIEWADAAGDTVIGYWPAGATNNGPFSNFPLNQLATFSGGTRTTLPRLPIIDFNIADMIAW